ncbi:MAG TPA: stage V sporulation protein D, partial [Eubacteriaceae bacterium]|nr:stage V sporulation protein D [Eubacteriaceae bacterium]
AAALEEGVVTEQTPFYCDGFVEVDGVKMRCHIYPREHGHQSFFEGVRNSCNPVMVETIRRMHPDTFYKYVYNFGFGERTGIELDGEQSGLVPLIKEDANVDYATKSFGQGISTTPIQLITALSAVVNGGSYYEPSVIKEIIDGETGKVKNDGTENEILRQVVTSENAEILKRIMQEVVAGSDFLQEGTQGYSMGGKTGTAQKIENGSYANGKYITSFFGFAPVEDPKVSILLIVDEPEGYGVTGSTTAAPYAIDVLANALNYMGIEPIVEEGELESSGETQEESTGRNVPDVRGYSVEMAQEILGQSDWDVQYRGDTESETAIVTNQEPMPGAVVSEQTKLFIDFSETQPDGQDGQGMITVPNVLDLSLRRAQKELENLGLSIQIEGNGGFSVKQEPQAGQQVERGTAIVVEFEHVKETDDEDEEKE